ncbi:28072_t:CDS:1, partial [Gigaspora margarita]
TSNPNLYLFQRRRLGYVPEEKNEVVAKIDRRIKATDFKTEFISISTKKTWL